ncbi:hypothetical protein BDB00DRAFT_354154 [Zychaea mexicana]|uniref:uncharacterized protein n=1 Tax=Zychaea mexicana TaxID=64656 RepID=UPI0022FE4F11|nr:uncharacterized protein BDB00DRAFT_354154 [Zychaea mexicana]KAI9493767.1 hypothetical protein BDB00DRAFT_354154 [Zychaea mexicana]
MATFCVCKFRFEELPRAGYILLVVGPLEPVLFLLLLLPSSIPPKNNNNNSSQLQSFTNQCFSFFFASILLVAHPRPSITQLAREKHKTNNLPHTPPPPSSLPHSFSLIPPFPPFVPLFFFFFSLLSPTCPFLPFRH